MKFSGNDRRAPALRGVVLSWIVISCAAQAQTASHPERTRTPPLQGASTQTPAPQPPGQSGVDSEVSGLLELAELAEASEHYIYPARGSAMSSYHEVLSLDPGNLRARQGLERIVEHYLEAAAGAMARRAYTRADAMLGRARLVDKHNPNIEPLVAQLRLLESAQRYRVTLDWRKLSARSAELEAPLAKIGARAKGEQCRASITVSNDAEGRWVYQKMSRSPGDSRIKAEVRIGSPAAVEVLCF